MPGGHESPSGAFKPQTGLRSKCRVFSAARARRFRCAAAGRGLFSFGTKREPERTAVPGGHESPSGAFKPQTGLRSKCRVFSAARARRFRRAAAGRSLFSFGTKREPEKCQRFRRAGPTRKGLLAPFNPKEDGLHTKKLAASLNAFLCSAISRPLSRCGGSSPQGSGCALSVTFGDTLSPFLSLRDIFPRPGEVFQRERQEALPLRPWLPFKRKARSVPSTLLALPPGELANPKGLTERAKGSPFGRAGAKRLRGFVPPQGASGSRYRSPLRPFP